MGGASPTDGCQVSDGELPAVVPWVRPHLIHPVPVQNRRAGPWAATALFDRGEASSPAQGQSFQVVVRGAGGEVLIFGFGPGLAVSVRGEDGPCLPGALGGAGGRRGGHQ
jgi:hypothetical protein